MVDKLTMMNLNKLPYFLVYSRIIFGLTIGITAIISPDFSGVMIAVIMFLGIISDILDGVIAWKLKIDTKALRVLDSNADLFFWTVAVIAIFGLNWGFVQLHWIYILIVFGLEFLAYLVCHIKFKKMIASHTYLAKIWSIILFLFLCELVLTSHSNFLFHAVIWLGVISRTEIIGILMLSKNWKTDVSSVFYLQSSKKVS